MQPLPDEQELIERTKNGDKQAVSVLYEAYVHHIFQYISYRVGSETIAEDLTADVFVRMIQGLPKYKYTGAPLGAWLFRIAANRVVDHYRENRQSPTSYDLAENLPTTNDLSDLLAQKEDQKQLLNALNTLSDDYRDVLIFRFVKDMPHAEVAEIMEKSEAAVRIMQHRALKALAKALAEHIDSTVEGRDAQNG